MAKLAILTIAASLAGCATLQPAQPVDTSCSAFRPITYSSSNDTAETITQVRAHNRVWEALCKGQSGEGAGT